MRKIGIRRTELLRLYLRLRSALSCSLQSLFLSTTSSKAEVHICQKAAPKENERRIYCPALLELNSLYNVLKCMGDTAVHIDSGPLSRKKKCQNQKQFRLRLIWKQLGGALNRFAIMALISKWVADHHRYTLDKSSEIINHCSALGLFIILTLVNSQREEKRIFNTTTPHTAKIIYLKGNARWGSRGSYQTLCSVISTWFRFEIHIKT